MQQLKTCKERRGGQCRKGDTDIYLRIAQTEKHVLKREALGALPQLIKTVRGAGARGL